MMRKRLFNLFLLGEGAGYIKIVVAHLLHHNVAGAGWFGDADGNGLIGLIIFPLVGGGPGILPFVEPEGIIGVLFEDGTGVVARNADIDGKVLDMILKSEGQPVKKV